jgi:hypothetical protein
VFEIAQIAEASSRWYSYSYSYGLAVAIVVAGALLVLVGLVLTGLRRAGRGCPLSNYVRLY